jgi:hypothetical protein
MVKIRWRFWLKWPGKTAEDAEKAKKLWHLCWNSLVKIFRMMSVVRGNAKMVPPIFYSGSQVFPL